MIRTKLFLAGALALMVTFAGTSAYAQEPTNQITYFTFSAPFELPGGKTLPAGKYVFKILDSPSSRHVVQIMSEDQQTVHATMLAIPANRQDPAPEPEVRFMETAANQPPAIRTWWYPGRSVGHEFIYPKQQARRLAATQKEGVLTVADDASTTEQMQSASLSRINASGQESPWNADTTVAENTTMPDQAGAAATAPQSNPAQASTAQTTTPTSAVNSSLQSTSGESTSPTATTSSTGTTASTNSSNATGAERNMNASASATTTTSAQSSPGSTSGQTTASASMDRTSTGTTQSTASRTSNDRNNDASTRAGASRTSLPQTATPLPLFGLLGLGSLIGAGALRLRR